MSELRAATISNLAGTGPVELTGQSAAKAWVNFNGTGTIAVGESFNTSSLTDVDTGRYLENLSSALLSTSFPSFSNLGGSFTDLGTVTVTSALSTATSVLLETRNSSFVRTDYLIAGCGCFGDLA